MSKKYPGFSILVSFGKWGKIRYQNKNKSAKRLCLGFVSIIIAFGDLDAMFDDPDFYKERKR